MTFAYDAGGNVTSLQPPGPDGAHTFAYTARNRLQTYTPPVLAGTGATTYTADQDGLTTGVRSRVR